MIQMISHKVLMQLAISIKGTLFSFRCVIVRGVFEFIYICLHSSRAYSTSFRCPRIRANKRAGENR